MNNSMINPSIVDLLKKVDSRYTLITVASKRARQLVDGAKPLVKLDSTKPVTVAINEIDKGLIHFESVREGIK
ncbi:MAG: DNA-directed RNA polymerase subunit omega [Clostridium sp.]|uniref:DNA-directed RNA polymerase subunit omega n=1 Tax=Clostridium sp. TaxID=1506 RepID=UPI0025C53483|nr:DNA-directed RNA polymerase subunit omega [Clostridium sp.]MCH3964045.1 DNA-directed RNA polymerase subunit omega [Clostridium sp.]MCI1716246.1 DNA-directed RNA polymerase subunit omega [Clostridium sp.]MCI1800514.1 DNA-directed RNA polymerase subunit omega [Clostridium sp.]MCI1814423.1 DNA-directed RNA polymerase subunit omega [Clostridium sp.]MCI1871322.1 DNA-directed RNA polymerase subunit omega [Clostridium sp.]